MIRAWREAASSVVAAVSSVAMVPLELNQAVRWFPLVEQSRTEPERCRREPGTTKKITTARTDHFCAENQKHV